MRVENIMNVKNKQKVYDKYPFFPSHLITKDEDNVPHYVIGTGGDGKTFNELKEAIDLFKSKKKINQTAILFPTKDDVDVIISKRNLFNKLLMEEDSKVKYAPFIRNLEFKGDTIYHNGNIFCRLYSLNQHHKYKIEDHSLIGNVWMDEAQRENYLPNEAFKTLDLISTLKRKKKPEDFRVSFTSNSISIDTPFLLAIGCMEIDEDEIITRVYRKTTGKLLAKVWKWSRPYADVKKQNNDDVWMEIFEESGYAEYRYGNNFKNDNRTNVVDIPIDILIKIGTYKHTLKMKDLIIDVYYVSKDMTQDGKPFWYFRNNDTKDAVDDIEYALNQEDANDKVKYKPNMSLEMARRLQRNKFKYDSIPVKNAVRQAVKRWI